MVRFMIDHTENADDKHFAVVILLIVLRFFSVNDNKSENKSTGLKTCNNMSVVLTSVGWMSMSVDGARACLSLDCAWI